jgi:hypothetical protein
MQQIHGEISSPLRDVFPGRMRAMKDDELSNKSE